MNATIPNPSIVEKRARYATFRRRVGAAQIGKAADRILNRDWIAIAEAFSEASQCGHLPSAKFLYAIARENANTGEGDGARKVRSIAEELAKAAQWIGDWPKVKPHEDD